MRLLVLCPHFAPDTAPTGEVMTSIATELVARGHELHVVTSLPWYQHHRIEPGWAGKVVRHEDTDWGRITRVHPFPTDKRNIPARAAGFAGFTVLSTALGLAGRRSARPDVVLAMSPPLTLGGAGWLAARRWGVPVRVQHPGRVPRRGRRAGRHHQPAGDPARVVARAVELPAVRRRHRAVRRPARQRRRPRSGARCPMPTTASG